MDRSASPSGVRRLAVPLLVALLFLASLPGTVLAAPVHGVGGTVVVEVGETVDSVEAVGGTVVIRGTVTGDVSVAAGPTDATDAAWPAERPLRGRAPDAPDDNAESRRRPSRPVRVTLDVVGGEAHEFEVEEATYADLLAEVGLSPNEVAVLVDGRPVPEDRTVEAGRAEVLRVVSGG